VDFADAVHSGLFYGQPLQEAIQAAVEKWMSWEISRIVRRLFAFVPAL
jgi:hypothetical protein